MNVRPARPFAVLLALLVLTSSLAAFAAPAAAASKADVVFVFDRTGSMSDERDALKQEIRDVADSLSASGIDARYALVAYESDGADTEVLQGFTSDAGDLKDALGFSFFGGTEDASDAINTTVRDELNFRSDASKIVVVITDEPDDSPSATRDDAINWMNEEDVTLLSVSPDDDDDDSLKSMAERTDNGRWVDIQSGSFESVIEQIIGTIEDVAGGGEGTSNADREAEFEFVNRSVNTTTVGVGEPVEVNVTVENVGDKAGEYKAVISDDLQVITRDTAEIAPGETHTFTFVLTFDEESHYGLFVNHWSIDRIVVEDDDG